MNLARGAKRASPALFFVFLFTCLAAADMSASEANEEIRGYVARGETFTKSSETLAGVKYWFVEVDGEEAMIFAEEGGDDLRVLSDAAEIRGVLAARLAQQNVSYALLPNASERDAIWGELVSFNESRSGEFGCFELIGMDRFPCYDLDSCWRACYTPACQTMKIGSGAVFLGYAQEMWMNGSFMDGNLSEARARVYAVSADDPGDWEQCNVVLGDECGFALERDILLLLSDIQSIRDSAGNNELNPIQLRDAVGFCYPMNYRYNGLINAAARITRSYDAVLPLLRLNSSTATIYGETQARIALNEGSSARGVCNTFKAEARTGAAITKAKVVQALRLITSDGLIERARALEAMPDALNCSEPELELEDVEEFSESFNASSSSLYSDAEAAIALYNSAKGRLAALRERADTLSGRSSLPAVVELSASVEALEVMMEMPDLSELAGIAGEIDGNESLAEQIAMSMEGVAPDYGEFLLPLAAVLVVAAGGAGAFFFFKSQKGRR